MKIYRIMAAASLILLLLTACGESGGKAPEQAETFVHITLGRAK